MSRKMFEYMHDIANTFTIMELLIKKLHSNWDQQAETTQKNTELMDKLIKNCAHQKKLILSAKACLQSAEEEKNQETMSVKTLIRRFQDILTAHNLEGNYVGNVSQDLSVYMSPEPWERIASNCIINSVKAEASKISFIYTEEERCLKIQIIDNGRGISEKTLEYLGLGFSTSGGGIGANTIMKLITEQGGVVSWDSIKTLGTVCTIKFRKAETKEINQRKLHKKILMVDDDAEICQFISEELKYMGAYHITSCENALDAMDLLKKEQFDLVISDLKMPTMDGLQFYDKYNEDNDPIPFLFVSGYLGQYNENIKKKQLKALRKPVDIDGLAQAIDAQLQVYQKTAQ